jgi:hypothetical protein
MKRYKPAIKAKIIQAAQTARTEGKTWREAHDAAKEAGYKGSLQGIAAMLKIEEKKTGKTKVKGRGRKPGRKAKADPITAFVEKMVEKRLKERVRKAIAALKGI